MAKVAGALRLVPEKWARVDGHAKARGCSRQVVLEAAVDAWLELAEGGVPDLPEADTPAARQARATPRVGKGVAAPSKYEMDMVRQRALNEAKYR